MKAAIAARLVEILAGVSCYRMVLRPEESLCVVVATRLRRLSLEGRLRAVWTHVGNENPVSSKLRVASLHGGKRKAMGIIPGAADFVFTWGDGGGWIELKLDGGGSYLAQREGELVLAKRPASQLSDHQRIFRDWCVELGVPHRVARSVVQVEDILRSWQVLDG